MTAQEEKQLSYFLDFRQKIHDGPLYTQTRSVIDDPGDTGRTYGQEQAKKRYGVKSKATVDPFWAVPMYTHRFTEKKRALPDLSGLRAVKEFFPAELHSVLPDETPDADARAAKRRKVPQQDTALSNIGGDAVLDEESPLDDAEQKQRALEALNNVSETHRGREGAKEEEEGREGEASEDDLDLDQDDDQWAIGRYDDDPEQYEDAEGEADEIEEEGEGDYEIQQHYEEGDDDDDGDGGDYEDGGD